MPETLPWAMFLMGLVALTMGLGLGVAAKFLAVKTDPRVEELLGFLPGANCGGCGFPGCSGYASALVEKGVDPALCAPGGSDTTVKIGQTMGLEVGDARPKVAVVQCRVGADPDWQKYEYRGMQGCKNSNLLSLGAGTCDYGCLGLLDCVAACPFDAIHGNPDPAKPPVVDIDKCTGCGMCVKACPKGIITLLQKERIPYVACKSILKGKTAKGDCKVACIACGLCSKKCPEKAIDMVSNLPNFDYEKCTSCGTCVEKCKPKCILWLESEKESVALTAAVEAGKSSGEEPSETPGA
ncbi:MAG: RnfABCDGE type electron transport complex subunit B [Planctomycetota bacterium]|jgi:Na+-translocating ferredoxin:NAD+ oxidoreductase RNF subunit RnfB